MLNLVQYNLSDLNEADRAKLIRVLAKRNDLARTRIILDEAKIAFLQDPTPEREEELAFLAKVQLAGARQEYSDVVMEVVKDALDPEGLQELLPILATAVLARINLPLALAALGVDADDLAELMDALKDALNTSSH